MEALRLTGICDLGLTDKVAFLETHPKTRFEPAIRFCHGLTKPQSVLTANESHELRDFFKKVGSNFSIKDGRVMCDFRGLWKSVAGQHRLGARRRAGGEPVVSDFAPHAKFSIWSPREDTDRTKTHVSIGPLRGNRTDSLVEVVDGFFKDNPTWEQF